MSEIQIAAVRAVALSTCPPDSSIIPGAPLSVQDRIQDGDREQIISPGDSAIAFAFIDYVDTAKL
jgi:hypothetical protein